jgi:hypothetical protein
MKERIKFQNYQIAPKPVVDTGKKTKAKQEKPPQSSGNYQFVE